MKTILIDLMEASNTQLDWALAILRGRAERRAVHAKDANLRAVPLPCELYEVSTITSASGGVRAKVSPITVTRFGVLEGAKLPTISFVDDRGQEGRGVAGSYYLTREEADMEAKAIMNGFAVSFRPATSWSHGGPLLDEYKIGFGPMVNSGGYVARATKGLGSSGTCNGQDHLQAAARSILACEGITTLEVPYNLEDLRAIYEDSGVVE